ncbi:MAG: hypothetical protein HQK49_07450 [Oligoflexia bacterium]|nr:hypothetical protein [Oligoflexia bacterium]
MHSIFINTIIFFVLTCTFTCIFIPIGSCSTEDRTTVITFDKKTNNQTNDQSCHDTSSILPNISIPVTTPDLDLDPIPLTFYGPISHILSFMGREEAYNGMFQLSKSTREEWDMGLCKEEMEKFISKEEKNLKDFNNLKKGWKDEKGEKELNEQFKKFLNEYELKDFKEVEAKYWAANALLLKRKSKRMYIYTKDSIENYMIFVSNIIEVEENYIKWLKKIREEKDQGYCKKLDRMMVLKILKMGQNLGQRKHKFENYEMLEERIFNHIETLVNTGAMMSDLEGLHNERIYVYNFKKFNSENVRKNLVKYLKKIYKKEPDYFFREENLRNIIVFLTSDGNDFNFDDYDNYWNSGKTKE